MRVYDKEFMEEAIRLSHEIGLKAASGQLEIPQTILYTWNSQLKQYGALAFVGSIHQRIDPRITEIRALEKKIRELESANDILKRALAFFADSQREVTARESFRFIKAQKAKNPTMHSVQEMCKVVKVSEAGYYKWLSRQSGQKPPLV